MNGKVTYLHHSSFVLELDGRTFLFDYPGEKHLVPGVQEAMQSAIEGKKLCVFISHSHEDHFNRDIEDLVSSAARVQFVLGDDILDMYPDLVPKGSLIAEPEERYDFMGIGIDTLMSNDLGVAFLIRVEGRTIYYGGDLANWNWDSDPVKQRRFTEKFFSSALERIAKTPVDVAFSNCDGRIRSLAGAAQFVRTVRPKLFVPMHTFGNLEWLDTFREQAGEEPSQLFLYTKSGDSLEFTL